MITCNGDPVLEIRLTLPLSRNWVVWLEVSNDEVVTGPIKIAAGTEFSGIVVRSGVLNGSCLIEAVGGKGGLAKPLPARSYHGVTVRTVLGDILAEAGEVLDASSSAAVLRLNLPFWTRDNESASWAISTLAEQVGANWRTLPSGAIWFGTETWGKAPASFDAIEMDADDASGFILIAPDNPNALNLRPGQTWEGHRVGRIEYHMGREAPMRGTIWPE
jgi:hypothetical protein